MASPATINAYLLAIHTNVLITYLFSLVSRLKMMDGFDAGLRRPPQRHTYFTRVGVITMTVHFSLIECILGVISPLVGHDIPRPKDGQ